MPFSMSKASVPVFETQLGVLAKLLDKAEAFAATKKIDPTVLLNTRLYPDMFAFTRQVQTACDQAKNATARLAGIDPPRFEDTETTVAQLRARIAKTLAFVKTIDGKAIDNAAEREIIIPLGPRKGQMKGEDYLRHFALPNFFFHVTAAYAILRHCGVELGKPDFMGEIPLKMI